MNQQLFEKGLKAFQEAGARDPKLQIAFLNQGIALLNLARIEPAKVLLEAAGKNAPNDPHAWFNLGLLYKNSDNPQGSVEAFDVTGSIPTTPTAGIFWALRRRSSNSTAGDRRLPACA